MANPQNLIKRAQKLERRESFLSLLDGIRTHSLTASQRARFLGRIMAKTASGAITPQEARKLTKAVSGESDRKKEG